MSFINRFTALSVMLLGFLFLSPAQAESACKGLNQSSCGGKSSCTWVDGYQRKDGKSVKAYCRSVSKKKSDNKKSTQPSSGSAKSSKPASGKESAKDKKTSSKSDKKSTKSKTADKKKPKKDAKKKSNKDTKKKSKKDNKKSS